MFIENNTWMCGNMTFILNVDQDISRLGKVNDLGADYMEIFQPVLKICLITWAISAGSDRRAEIERGVSETFPTVSQKQIR